MASSVATRPKMRSFEIVVVTEAPVTVVAEPADEPDPVVTVAAPEGSNGLTVFAPETPKAIPVPALAPALNPTSTGIPDCGDVAVA